MGSSRDSALSGLEPIHSHEDFRDEDHAKSEGLSWIPTQPEDSSIEGSLGNGTSNASANKGKRNEGPLAASLAKCLNKDKLNLDEVLLRHS